MLLRGVLLGTLDRIVVGELLFLEGPGEKEMGALHATCELVVPPVVRGFGVYRC